MRIEMKEKEFEFDFEELDALEESNKGFVKKRMIFWFIRWVIGFSIIGVVVHYKPSLSWLWWGGLAICLVTPLMVISSTLFLKKKSISIKDKVQDIQKEIRLDAESDNS
jgi:hypothetical protein